MRKKYRKKNIPVRKGDIVLTIREDKSATIVQSMGAFTQAASMIEASDRDVNATQTMGGFTQAASMIEASDRDVNATQSMGAFTQSASMIETSDRDTNTSQSMGAFTQALSVEQDIAQLALFPVAGDDIAGLSYIVLDSYDIATATILAAGTDAAIVSNVVNIDLSGVAVLDDEVILVLTDFTTSPNVSSKASVAYTTVVEV